MTNRCLHQFGRAWTAGRSARPTAYIPIRAPWPMQASSGGRLGPRGRWQFVPNGSGGEREGRLVRRGALSAPTGREVWMRWMQKVVERLFRKGAGATCWRRSWVRGCERACYRARAQGVGARAARAEMEQRPAGTRAGPRSTSSAQREGRRARAALTPHNGCQL